MPKVPAQYLEARRRGILAAAQRCVSRNGIQGTTMRDICRAANLSPGAIYRYFDSKEQILGALAEQRQAQIRTFFGRLESASSRKALADAVTRLAADLDSEAASDGLRLDLHLWSRALKSPEVATSLGPGLESAVRAVDEALGTGRPEGSGRLIVALLQGLALHKALDPELDLGELGPAIQDLLGT
ncbi:MAG: TetR/AcrR family transcriptional regulator [bacterium]|nr:TetR/AcrR family transcriptional regulator [bacterium]